MLKTTDLARLGVAGTIYDFPQAGDELPVHVHSSVDQNHITIVARGSVRVEGHPDHAGRILTAGDIADWPVGIAHGFVAMDDGARIVNIRKA